MPYCEHVRFGALHRFDQQPDHGEDVLVGTFRFWFVGEHWEWSDEVAAMHGYAPGSVVPTSALVLSHKHPDDRLHVQELLDRALHDGEPFSNTHRVIDTAGRCTRWSWWPIAWSTSPAPWWARPDTTSI